MLVTSEIHAIVSVGVMRVAAAVVDGELDVGFGFGVSPGYGDAGVGAGRAACGRAGAEGGLLGGACEEGFGTKGLCEGIWGWQGVRRAYECDGRSQESGECEKLHLDCLRQGFLASSEL